MHVSRRKTVRPLCAILLIVAHLVSGGAAWAATIPQPSNASPFTLIGFIQQATLDAPGDVLAGGTVKVNGTTVIIPRNTIVQMPNTYLTWTELFTMAPAPWGPTQTGLALADTDAAGKHPVTTYEITLFGNRIVDPADGTDKYVAGLVSISQESLNFGQGMVNFIDYDKGELHVGGTPNVSAPTDTRVVINDPVGRFGIRHSPDPRFTADTDNATIHAKTGYPMCIPRTDPAKADDALCPQANRPLDAAGNPIGNFTMPAQGSRTAGSPDSKQQAPIKVGDFVEYAGTLQQDAAGRYVSAFQIIPNVGIYTFPGDDPAYLSLETTVLGVGGNPIPGVAQENNNRIVIVGFTTDTIRPVDAFAVEVDPCTGEENERVISTLGPLIPELVPRGRVRFAQLISNANPPTRNWRLRYAGSPPQSPSPEIANGIIPLQYTLPVNEYVFPENTIFGDATLLAVPLNFQDFPFLTLGSGPWRTATGPIVGQLKPFPLVEIPGMSPAIPTPPVCSPTAARAPKVQAGTPQTAQAGTTVTLTATGTDGNTPPRPLTFTFTQTSGTPVTLPTGPVAAVNGAASVTFTAPPLAATAAPLTLTFSVTANNGVVSSPASTTFVTVSPFLVRDAVLIGTATYDLGRGTLTVTANTTDTTGNAVLFLTTDTGFGPIQMSTAPGLGAFTFTQKGIFPQPLSVTVVSSEGGTATAFLRIIGRPPQVQRRGGGGAGG
jgi:hypothetical protein